MNYLRQNKTSHHPCRTIIYIVQTSTPALGPSTRGIIHAGLLGWRQIQLTFVHMNSASRNTQQDKKPQYTVTRICRQALHTIEIPVMAPDFPCTDPSRTISYHSHFAQLYRQIQLSDRLTPNPSHSLPSRLAARFARSSARKAQKHIQADVHCLRNIHVKKCFTTPRIRATQSTAAWASCV